MAIVTGKTSAKIDELLGGTLINGVLNSLGQLTFTKGDGSVVNAGSVSSHLVGAAISNASRLIFTRRDGTTFDAGQVSRAIDSYPVGAIYLSTSATNPSTLFGGTWVQWGQGRVPVGVDPAQSEFDTVEETGGEKEHVLSVAEMPAHSHSGTAASAGAHNHDTTTWGVQAGVTNGNLGVTRHSSAGADYTYKMGSSTDGAHTHAVTTVSQGGGTPHNVLQPYITCYMWKRTA